MLNRKISIQHLVLCALSFAMTSGVLRGELDDTMGHDHHGRFEYRHQKLLEKERAINPNITLQEALKNAAGRRQQRNKTKRMSSKAVPACIGGQSTTISDIKKNFLAVRQSETPEVPLGTPPDTMFAVGPEQIVLCINNGVVSYDKETGQRDGILDTSLDCLFDFCGADMFDPRIMYDVFEKNWYAVAIDTADDVFFLNNNLYVAVADTHKTNGVITPSTKWRTYKIQLVQVPEGDGPNHRNNGVPLGSPGELDFFNDFPTLAIDKHALYVNITPVGGGYFGFNDDFRFFSDLYVIQKESLADSKTPIINAYRKLGDFDLDFSTFTNVGTGVYRPIGMDNFDQKQNQGFILGVAGALNNILYMFHVENPGSKSPIVSDQIPIEVPAYTAANGGSDETNHHAPHKGNLAGFDGVLVLADPQLAFGHIRNGKLFTCHSNITVNAQGEASNTFDFQIDRQAIRWYQFDDPAALTPQVSRCGLIFDPNDPNPDSYYFGSIMSNSNEDLVIGCSVSGEERYIQAVAFTRAKNDPNGTFGPEQIIGETSAVNPSYNFGPLPDQRWGDYSRTVFDPCDPKTLWTVQQYAIDTDEWAINFTKLKPQS